MPEWWGSRGWDQGSWHSVRNPCLDSSSTWRESLGTRSSQTGHDSRSQAANPLSGRGTARDLEFTRQPEKHLGLDPANPRGSRLSWRADAVEASNWWPVGCFPKPAPLCPVGTEPPPSACYHSFASIHPSFLLAVSEFVLMHPAPDPREPSSHCQAFLDSRPRQAARKGPAES